MKPRTAIEQFDSRYVVNDAGAENTRRGRSGGEFNSAKTHCPQGHPYVGDNLVLRSDGRRVCRTCKAKRSREYDIRTGRKR